VIVVIGELTVVTVIEVIRERTVVRIANVLIRVVNYNKRTKLTARYSIY
jgi:hypothetical protein